MTGPSCSRPRARLTPGGRPRHDPPPHPRARRDPRSHPRSPPQRPRPLPRRRAAEVLGAESGAAVGPPETLKEQSPREPPWSRTSRTWWSCRTRTRGTWSGGSSSPMTAS
ncbi:serine/arginine repetitive matrix protein 1-like [Haemorhous mexicanus]|uniref:serine/arginine repetitive matrix protein 1-like n=1 Tax=Haemorhous mexicanus TaxID=30427 RepID=UPI0028BE6AC1|nr:serine/arginine repetitive matrix protein 1-like [Haemorhous mexicanus]